MNNTAVLEKLHEIGTIYTLYLELKVKWQKLLNILEIL